MNGERRYVQDDVCSGEKWLLVGEFQNVFTVEKVGREWKVSGVRAMDNFISMVATEGTVPRMSSIIAMGVDIAIAAAENRATRWRRVFRTQVRESEAAPTDVYSVPNVEHLKFPFVIQRNPMAGTDLQFGIVCNKCAAGKLEVRLHHC